MYRNGHVPNWLYPPPPPAVPTAVHTNRRHPVDKDCGLLHPTIYSFLLSDCLLLDVAPSLLLALAHGTTYLPMSPQHHLFSPSEND